jgi:hypothetical protein
MIKITAVALISCLAMSCGIGVTTRAHNDAARVKTGETLTLPSAVVYECDAQGSSSQFWVYGAKNHCLKAREELTDHDKVLEIIASGTSAQVSGVRVLKGLDTSSYLAYLRISGVQGEVIVYDFSLHGLLQAPRHGR